MSERSVEGAQQVVRVADDVVEKVKAADLREDWGEVLKWEGHMEEMI